MLIIYEVLKNFVKNAFDIFFIIGSTSTIIGNNLLQILQILDAVVAEMFVAAVLSDCLVHLLVKTILNIRICSKEIAETGKSISLEYSALVLISSNKDIDR